MNQWLGKSLTNQMIIGGQVMVQIVRNLSISRIRCRLQNIRGDARHWFSCAKLQCEFDGFYKYLGI